MQVKDEMKRQGWLLGGIKVGSRPAVAGNCESEGAGGKGTAVRKMECVFPLRPDVEVSASMDACVVLVHYGCGCCVCVLAHTSGMYLFLASDDVRARAQEEAVQEVLKNSLLDTQAYVETPEHALVVPPPGQALVSSITGQEAERITKSNKERKRRRGKK